ncbi:MAG: hypothetical protein II375_08670 [Bacteroidales bacterium]|nr:hypothetical protein [Bacteroidales bacterium]
MGFVLQYIIVAAAIILAAAYAIRRCVTTWRAAKRKGRCADCHLAETCAKKRCEAHGDHCCG